VWVTFEASGDEQRLKQPLGVRRKYGFDDVGVYDA
jgi:hypothetical protein